MRDLLSCHCCQLRVVALVVVLALSSTPVVVTAEKDGDYYLPGFSNPNTKNNMYWKDSINVLQDLDQFQALYVTYHGCVWSKYGTRYGSGENYDEQGQDQPDDDNYQNDCGGFGGEYFWYMGRTQCFKANVAYSLYGVLKGSTANGCSKHTYINSFFTTFGAESFTGPLGLGIDYGNSQCVNEQPENMYLQDDAVAADDDYLDDQFQFYDYKAFTSMGTGCSADGDFVTDSYTGAFCHGQNYVETVDTLDTFNQQMKSFDCTQIYDGSQELEDLDENEDGDYNFEEMDAINLLAFSKSCSLRQYPHDCPDPHGIKRGYARNINNAFYLRTGGNRDIAQKLMGYTTYVFAAMGVLLLTMACLIRQRMESRNSSKSHSVSKQERRKAREAKREAQHKQQRKSRSKTRKNHRGVARSPSGESTHSKGSSKGGGNETAVERIGAAISSYEAPKWTAFGGSGSTRSSTTSPTRTQEVAAIKTSGGTVNIAMTETVNKAINSWTDDDDDEGTERKNRVKAGSFSKFFRNSVH